MNFKDAAAAPRHIRRIIERPEQPFFVGEQFHDFLLVPQMVAAGNDVHAGGKNVPGGHGRNTGAAGGVLAVGDDEIERVLFAKFGQEFLDRVASRPPDDVADEEQFHNRQINRKSP